MPHSARTSSTSSALTHSVSTPSRTSSDNPINGCIPGIMHDRCQLTEREFAADKQRHWVMGGPWTYEGGHDFAMHGPDKEFYDELVSTVASGVVGRGMYDAAGAWGGTNPFPGPLFVLTHRTADQPATETGFRFVADLDAALAQAAEVAGD